MEHMKHKEEHTEETSTHHEGHAEHRDHVRHTGHEDHHRTKILTVPIVSLLVILVLAVGYNQLQINSLSDSSVGILRSGSSRISLFSGGGGGNMVGPQINADGRTTQLVEWPTISEVPDSPDTGNPTQDAISYVIPTGTPFYVASGPGSERLQGITFDDPIQSQQIWASFTGSSRFAKFGSKVDLTAEQEARWDKLTGIFTCEYCCGGPSQVTTINRCGCAHAYAWQGMARFFLGYYGDDYTDEEILGEMTRWKGLWYPKGMIQDYLVFTGEADASTLRHGGSAGIVAQFAGQGGGGTASVSELQDLPGMVGGC